jgi:hypothetical protein
VARAADWPRERDAVLAGLFEDAATSALRAPVISERSVLARKVAKRIVPERLRPLARRAVRRFDGAVRAVADVVDRRL